MKRICLLFALCVMVCSVVEAAPLPCAGPTLAAVIAQGPCMIGDMTFTFSNNFQGHFDDTANGTSIPITPDELSFTPLNSGSSPGFQIDNFPSATSTGGFTSQAALFSDAFTAVPPSAQMITSTTAQLNLPVVTGAPTGETRAEAEVCTSTNNCAVDIWEADFSATPTELVEAGGAVKSSFSGYFNLGNAAGSSDVPDSAGFLNAQFNFNESPTTIPEPTSLALLGSGLVFGAGVLRRRWFERNR